MIFVCLNSLSLGFFLFTRFWRRIWFIYTFDLDESSFFITVGVASQFGYRLTIVSKEPLIMIWAAPRKTSCLKKRPSVTRSISLICCTFRRRGRRLFTRGRRRRGGSAHLAVFLFVAGERSVRVAFGVAKLVKFPRLLDQRSAIVFALLPQRGGDTLISWTVFERGDLHSWKNSISKHSSSLKGIFCVCVSESQLNILYAPQIP